ncbi:type VI secretion system-associated protein TagF [Oceaniglobus trochenteri]|uniref:type VI secretion system-associated protein TagF n=1 Tax=Oceaniglobus trochenteri TaxID=2763260 RepID=UPI001CFF998B|nr:type VI secretion system-associated protein TagF [Oceaniglobus trochenteri]
MPDVVLTMGWGLYGKLPTTGDFVRHGLGKGFVEPWDRWLQTGIAGAREAMGGRWQGCYMSAPIWRFSLGDGVAGGQAMAGILMASVDRVGRQFPLTLAAPIAGPHAAVHLGARPLFEALEDLALAALDDMPLERLKDRLADLPPPPAARASVTAGGMTVMPGGDDIAPALAAPYLATPTLWSASCAGGMRMMQGSGLPQGARFAAMFDMDAPAWPVTP